MTLYILWTLACILSTAGLTCLVIDIRHRRQTAETSWFEAHTPPGCLWTRQDYRWELWGQDGKRIAMLGWVPSAVRPWLDPYGYPAATQPGCTSHPWITWDLRNASLVEDSAFPHTTLNEALVDIARLAAR